MESAETEFSLLVPGSGSGPSNGLSEPPISPDSPGFARHPGDLGTVREVAEDDPSGRFADLLDTVEGVLPDGSDSDEKKASRAENIYVALDDKVGWVSRKRRDVMPDERSTSAERVTALEKALTGFADRDSESVVTPSVGLSFDSINEAYEFYNLYSWECGFGVRYAKSRTNVKGTKCMQEFVCCCSGKPKETNSKSSRCQCQAMIRLLRTDDEGWYINEFRSNHNHPMLSTCAEKLHFPSHRHIDKYTRELVSQLRQNNVNLSKVYSIIATFFGRVENVPFTKRCLRTLCGKLSREQADDDVRKTMAIFSEMKAQDSEFTYNVQVDDESRIRTLMWTNGRSKTQYYHFGDVVTFDTTYKTNLYDMPFGLFVGVNNHFQSVLYAGVLMRDETEDTFKWIFDEFVKMMGGKKPITILTDQARAMEKAIQDVYPDSTHRWCKWHVLKKAKENLGAHYTKKSDFRAEFHKLVHEMLTIDEFEDGWAALSKYSLKNNPYLTQIYETRELPSLLSMLPSALLTGTRTS